ncbi:hypothetical protein [Streptomyces sp. CA-111067]|uniref:hypothetical protein n=1 Tax=Streptomyces sp. CA-111067 TaxID=3240046 RepID=UPI003D985E18
MTTAGLCPEPTCRRPYVLTADGKIRFHNTGGKRTTPECPGSGEPPGPWSPDDEPLTSPTVSRDDEIRAATYREAANDLTAAATNTTTEWSAHRALTDAARRLRAKADALAPPTT